MSKFRRCDRRCHQARSPSCECVCWCGGLFHGREGTAAREAFQEVYRNPVPAEHPAQCEPLLYRTVFVEAMKTAREAFERAKSDRARATVYAAEHAGLTEKEGAP